MGIGITSDGDHCHLGLESFTVIMENVPESLLIIVTDEVNQVALEYLMMVCVKIILLDICILGQILIQFHHDLPSSIVFAESCF